MTLPSSRRAARSHQLVGIHKNGGSPHAAKVSLAGDVTTRRALCWARVARVPLCHRSLQVDAFIEEHTQFVTARARLPVKQSAFSRGVRLEPAASRAGRPHCGDSTDSWQC